MKTLGVIALAASCATTLAGCKMLEQLKKSGEAATQAASAGLRGGNAPAGDEEKDSELADKLEGYIYCMNYETRNAFRSKQMYARDVDPEKGPTGKESSVYVQQIEPAACIQRIGEAKAKQPPLADVEAAAAGYQTALSALQQITKQAHDYYDQKDFKDDKFAKGIAMHKPLMAAYDAFEKADKPFEDKVSALNEALSQRRLARLKNDPTQVLPYDVAKSVDDAKKLVHFAEVDSLEQVDLAGLTAAIATYEQSLDALSSYATAHPDEAGKVSMLSSFQSASADFLKASKELMRRKRDNKGFKGESLPPEMLDGHPANVLAKFNDMINRSNSLTYR